MQTSPATAKKTSIWALILKKDTSRAKSRLSSVLNEGERRTLAEEMFEHVLQQTLLAKGIHRIAVVSPEKPTSPADVVWIADKWNDMNLCIRHGIRKAAGRGADQVLVLPSDLPTLCATDLETMLGCMANNDLVIAPDECEEGTNALLINTEHTFDPMFGPNSYQRHIAQARHWELNVGILHNAGIAFDLDDQQDWERYHAATRAANPAPHLAQLS